MAETTTVTKKEVTPEDLNELLDIPGAENILNAEEDRPGFFSQGEVDLSFIGKKPKKEVKPEDKTETAERSAEKPAEESVQEVINEADGVKPEETQPTGRPKVSKDAAIELTRKLIEKGTLVPFDDDKKIEDYTTADFEELYEANLRDKEDRIKAEIPIEFFDSLPQELQYAAKYVADGGKDLRGLFKALSDVEETRVLSEESPEDQETIVREYLTIKNWGTPQDITEEISSWKDLNKLEEKATKFKPLLDKMRSDQLAHRLATQEQNRKQQQEAAQNYQNSIYETLKPGKINDLSLDKKTQGMLFNGLTQSQYTSLSGRPTNLLGHLIEKYQVVEPNHALIAEITWHLEDPEGFKNKVREQGKSAATETIVRKLKTEESRKIASASSEEREDTGQTRKIPRSTNFFKR